MLPHTAVLLTVSSSGNCYSVSLLGALPLGCGPSYFSHTQDSIERVCLPSFPESVIKSIQQTEEATLAWRVKAGLLASELAPNHPPISKGTVLPQETDSWGCWL